MLQELWGGSPFLKLEGKSLRLVMELKCLNEGQKRGRQRRKKSFKEDPVLNELVSQLRDVRKWRAIC